MSVKTFTNTYKKVIIESLIFLIIISFGLYELQRANHLKTELAISGQNLIAANDTIRITKDKLGHLEADKLVYVSTIKDLNKLNSDLLKEAKAVKGSVTTIIKSESIAKGETGTIPSVTKEIIDSTSGDTTLITNFNKDTTYSKGNYSKVSGIIEYNTKNKGTIATINKNEIGFDIITGIKNLDKGKPEIFFKSNYPNFTITSLNGAILDPKLFGKPKQKKLSIGLQLGYSPLSYNLDSKSLNIVNQITLGAGINYRIF